MKRREKIYKCIYDCILFFVQEWPSATELVTYLFLKPFVLKVCKWIFSHIKITQHEAMSPWT
jgi:hypothetical protein